MNSKTILGAVGVVGLVSLLFLSSYWQSALVADLPPRVVADSQAGAFKAAADLAVKEGGTVNGVLGTGSMVPYIPAAAPGLDPKTTVVAYVVVSGKTGYGAVVAGKLCVYFPESAPSERWIHIAAQKDGDGWIMTGLANKNYESWMRMGPKNFVGVAQASFVWNN